MKKRDAIAAALSISVLLFLALACCCPMAFPIGDWSTPSDSSSTDVAVAKLEISTPTDGAVTDSPQIDISGYTDSDATVTVNGTEMTVNSDGSFEGVVDLQSGENTLIFTAVRPGGDPAIKEIAVTSNCST
jgi:hypothetical protein